MLRMALARVLPVLPVSISSSDNTSRCRSRRECRYRVAWEPVRRIVMTAAIGSTILDKFRRGRLTFVLTSLRSGMDIMAPSGRILDYITY